MEVHIREQRGQTGALRHPVFGIDRVTINQHTALQEPHDQIKHPGITDAFSQQLNQVRVRHVIKEAFDVGVTDPVHFLPSDELTESGECLVAGSARPKAIGSVMEISFVDWLQDHRNSTLDNIVFHGRDAERTRFAIPFRDVTTQTRLGVVSATMQSRGEFLQILLKMLFVLFHAHVIDPARFTSFESAERVPEQLRSEQRVEVVENLLWRGFRAFGDAIQTIHNRRSATGCRWL